MALHPDAVDGRPFIEELLGQRKCVPFSGIGLAVVVVKEEGVGIHLVGEPKGVLDVILAHHPEPRRIPQLPGAAVLLDRFIDDVPLVDATG